MRFTKEQYAKAIESLTEASQQLEPDGNCCACCGDGGHQAFECGFNPLVAMAICKQIADDSRALHDELHAGEVRQPREKLHEIVHWLGGFDLRMGEQVGPAKIKVP